MAYQQVNVFRTTPRIVMGPGAVRGIGEEARRLGARRALVVTDPGVVNAGLLEPVTASLKAARVRVAIFDAVEPDPRHEIVAKAHDFALAERADCVIGLGGGSSIDIAKTSAILLGNEGPISRYYGVDLVPKPGAPTIMVPTTAGTASEVTNIAILSDHADKLKKGVVSPYLFPSVALCDPELTLGLPAHVTASSGMDALIHAVESYLSVNATRLTKCLAREAMTLLFGNIRAACADGRNLAARTAMMEGSLIAGLSFANAGCAAVHAFAYPIGAEFHIPHGVANTLMLCPVMEFNLVGAVPKFAEMARIFGEETIGLSERDAAGLAVSALDVLAGDLNVPRHLADFGVTEAHIGDLAAGVMKVTRLLANNPRLVTQKDAEAIYRQAL